MNDKKINTKLPDFIIVGAAKSGTTSLYNYLNQHPQVCMSSMKEARYLAYFGNEQNYKGYGKNGNRIMQSYDSSMPKSMRDYLNLFSKEKANQIKGDCSPAYLYLPQTAEKISELIPNVKIIMILRNPIERAYSSYLHMRRENAEIKSFIQALREEKKRIQDNAGLPWRYVDMGKYNEQISRYKSYFKSENIKIVLYDDLKNNPQQFIKDIYRFLSIDSEFKPDMRRKDNVSGIPKNYFLYNLISKINYKINSLSGFDNLKRKFDFLEKKLLSKPSMNFEEKAFLNDALKKDIRALSLNLKRDLNSWLHT